MKAIVVLVSVFLAIHAFPYNCKVGGTFKVAGLITTELRKVDTGNVNVSATFPITYKERRFNGAMLYIVDTHGWQLGTAIPATKAGDKYHVLFGVHPGYMKNVILEVNYVESHDELESRGHICNFSSSTRLSDVAR